MKKKHLLMLFLVLVAHPANQVQAMKMNWLSKLLGQSDQFAKSLVQSTDNAVKTAAKATAQEANNALITTAKATAGAKIGQAAVRAKNAFVKKIREIIQKILNLLNKQPDTARLIKQLPSGPLSRQTTEKILDPLRQLENQLEGLQTELMTNIKKNPLSQPEFTDPKLFNEVLELRIKYRIDLEGNKTLKSLNDKIIEINEQIELIKKASTKKDITTILNNDSKPDTLKAALNNFDDRLSELNRPPLQTQQSLVKNKADEKLLGKGGKD